MTILPKLLTITKLVLPITVSGFVHPQSIKHLHVLKPTAKTYQQQIPLRGLNDDNSEVEGSNDDLEDNFDGKGFANYLGPYALALMASIAVTAAFVKFVLLDY